MTTGPLASTDPSLTPRTRTFLVYDRATGEVLHTHRATRFAANPPDREAPEARARRMAGQASADVEVIEVDEGEINQRKPVRVDVATGRVVVIDD
jgi:hypothetical protein